MKTPTERWYKTTGWRLLNDAVISVRNFGLRKLPLCNIEGIPDGIDLNELKQLMKEDGGNLEVTALGASIRFGF